jgi:hypothetical protein
MGDEFGREPNTTYPPRDESNAALALFAAIAQMGLALRESQEPVAELGSLIAHLGESLAALRSAPFGAGDPASVPEATVRGLIEQLQSDVYRGIQQLQFYDRMVQHLSRLQEYLIGVADQLGSAEEGGESDAFWDELHAKLRRRLISDEQRGLFDLFLSSKTGVRVSARSVCAELAPPGSLELF